MIKYNFAKKNPLFIWGAPGIGKTQIVNAFGKSNGLDVITFTLSVRDPIDFLGLPSIENGKTIYNAPGIFPPSKDTLEGKEEEKGKGGILFFDEMNLGNSMVLKAAMRLILDRRLDSYILPDNWVVFAAGNRQEAEAPNAETLSHALANRMKHVNFVPNEDEWIEWARSDKAVDDKGNQLVADEIIAFIKFAKGEGKNFLHYLEDDDNGSQSPAWASPRSWVEASKEYLDMQADAKTDGRELNDREIELTIGANVGRDMALAFIAFLNLIKTIDIDKLKYVYTNPKQAPLPKKGANGQYNPSEVYAIISAIVYSGGKDKKKLTLDEFNNVVEYCVRLNSGDFAVAFLKMI
jgi:hypothetical protein